MNAITAKMRCHTQPPMSGETENVSLSAVTGMDGNEINKEWAKLTPCGSLNLSIDNKAAQGFFHAGKEYIVTIREATPISLQSVRQVR